MRYMGGKFRQRRAIADALRPYINGETTYVEPFLGGGWSFAHVIETCKPRHAIGADVNGSLVELWRRVVVEGVDWLPVSLEEVEANYHAYKDAQDMSDPLTAWYGVACSFGGKWYGGVARSKTTNRSKGEDAFAAQARSTERKAASMRECPDLALLCCSYDDLEIPDGAVVYCDPPYSGGKSRTKAHRFDDFDVDAYYAWVRDLSTRCVVVCSTFDPPEDFEVLHDWGDTRVTHLNGRDRAERPTTEKLIRYEGGLR
jgi:DNA adenine methylase